MNKKIEAIKVKIQEASQIADNLASTSKKIADSSITKISSDINELIEIIELELVKNSKQKTA